MGPPRSLEITALDETDGDMEPFWSPDSRALGFCSNGKLMSIRVPGGAPAARADAPDPRGGSWGAADTIVFAPRAEDALSQIAASGSQVSAATVLGGPREAHRWPAFLPDGRHFVYLVARANARWLRPASIDSLSPAPEAWTLSSDSGAIVVPADGMSALL